MTYGNGSRRTGKTRNNNGPGIKDKQLITSIPKTEATSINVNLLSTEDGDKVVDVRNWYTTQYEPDTLRPSKQGIWIPLEAAKEVAEGILMAIEISEQKEASTPNEE